MRSRIRRPAVLARLTAEVAARFADSRLDAWMEETLRSHASFWAARLARERAIAVGSDPGLPFQASLFTKLPEWQHRADIAHRAGIAEHGSRRIESAASRMDTRLERPAALLVLVP